MTVYQLYVEGFSDSFEGKFKCRSQKIKKSHFTEEEKQSFIDACSGKDGQEFLENLDTKSPYKLTEIELDLIN